MKKARLSYLLKLFPFHSGGASGFLYFIIVATVCLVCIAFVDRAVADFVYQHQLSRYKLFDYFTLLPGVCVVFAPLYLLLYLLWRKKIANEYAMLFAMLWQLQQLPVSLKS